MTTTTQTLETTRIRAKTVARRAEILDAARTLLLEQGEIPIAALAKRSGASVGSLYHHFGSKDGIVQATAAGVTATYQASLSSDLRPVPMDLKRTVKAIVQHHAGFVRAHPEPARLLHLLHVPPDTLLAEARPRIDALVRGAADKREVDPIPARLLGGLLLGPVLHAALGRALREKDVTFLARAAWRSIRARS